MCFIGNKFRVTSSCLIRFMANLVSKKSHFQPGFRTIIPKVQDDDQCVMHVSPMKVVLLS